MKSFIAFVAALATVPVLAQDPPGPCELIKLDEVNAMVDVPANKSRTHPTKAGQECSYMDSGQKAVLTLEVRSAKLPKAELDQEADTLQKIYRTSIKPLEIGDGGFWLPVKGELYFRKGKRIVRLVIAPGKDPKIHQTKTESIARLIETRLPK